MHKSRVVPFLLITVALAGFSFGSLSAATQRTAANNTPDVSKQRALIDQYCVGCHNSRLKRGNLVLEDLDLAHLTQHAEVGEKIVRKLRAGMMPPTDARRPDAATMDALILWME